MEEDRPPADALPDTAPRTYWGEAEPQRPPPPPGTAYAGVGIRFAAWLIDLVPVLVFTAVLFLPIGIGFVQTIVQALPDRPQPGQTNFPEVQAAMADALVAAFPGFLRASALLQLGGLLYFAGSWLAFSRTPGKALLGLRIVREEDGGRLDVGRVAVRYAGYLLSAIPLLLGFAWAIFDRRQQTWHDKLAGTLVVRSAPNPGAVGYPPLAATIGSRDVAHKRPSIGAIAERAWQTFRRSPLDLLATLAVVLVPAMLLLIPLIALYFVEQQDQSVLSVRSMRDLFAFAGDPAAMQEYNRRMFAATAPMTWIGGLMVSVGAVIGSLLIAACAAAFDEARDLQPTGTATRALTARLPAVLVLGVGAGLVLGGQMLLLGLPALSLASAETPAAADIAFLGAIAVLGLLVITPAVLYFGVIWALAVVCAVKEQLGVTAAIRRAWEISRGRMRWLIGIMVAAGLASVVLLGPIGWLPIGLLSEAYLDGQRLPVVLSIALIALLTLATAPIISLAYVEAYRAARDDVARR